MYVYSVVFGYSPFTLDNINYSDGGESRNRHLPCTEV